MTMSPAAARPIFDALRPSARALPESGIVKVFNHGRGKDGLIPLWAGEADLPTPAFIADAAHQSMLKGETFYTHNRGIPDLRQMFSADLRWLRHYGFSLLDVPTVAGGLGG